MKCSLWLLLGLLISSSALAANEYQVAKRVEASMVVTGSIVVNPDGSVNSYTLDKQDKLPSSVVALIDKTVQSWKFRPIFTDGKPETAKAVMSLRILARKLDDDRFALSVAGASFGKDAPDQSITYVERKPPRYPPSALDSWVSGIVYLDILVSPQGTVDQAAIEQIDLRKVASDDQMKVWRNMLGEAALKAATSWTFHVPQSADFASATNRVVRVPVNFNLVVPGATKPAEYGDWDGYVPGPVQHIAWLPAISSDRSADAVPNNGLAFQDDERFVLLDPPGDG